MFRPPHKRTRAVRPVVRLRPPARRLTAEYLEDRRLLALTTMDLTTGLTPLDLVQSLLGGGVEISNVTIQGDPSALGLFSGGMSEGLGVDSGVVLSSGSIANAVGPNDDDFVTASFGTAGDPDLSTLIPQGITNDAAVLEFDFTVTASPISFLYVFASDEYNEFVNSSYNDVFGFFLDGVNIALIPGTTTPVSINNVNKNLNSQFYNNNDPTDFGIPPFLTQADGFTTVFQALATVDLGTHHIKLAVADAVDTALDSWVFLQSGSFVAGTSDMAIDISDSPDPVLIGNPLTYTMTVTNQGPDPALGVVAENVLPPGVTFSSVSSSQGTVSFENGTIVAELGALGVGASATVTVVVTPTELGTVTHTATVTALQPEPDPSDNTTTETSTVVTPQLVINDAQIAEGNSGTKDLVFTVSLNAPNLLAATSVQYNTASVTAQGGSDYLPRSGVLVLPSGVQTGSIAIPIVSDLFNEITETFLVQLSSPVNAEIVDGIGIGTIIDNDPLPNFYVSDIYLTTTTVGNYTAYFTVALDRASGREVSVSYYTGEGTARDGIEYLGRTGSLAFAPGVTTLHVSVPVMTSNIYGPNRKFYLRLEDATNATLFDPEGAATIVYAPEQQGEYIVDDGDAAYTKNHGWSNLTNTLGYQLDYDYAAAGNGSSTATWNFVGVPNGSYEVFARWSNFGNRATNAPYTVLDLGVPVGTVLVNQQLAPSGEYSNGFHWQSLGFFSTTTNNLAVRLSNNANGYVVADAVRIVAGGIAPQSPEMDVSANDRSIITGDVTPSYEDATHFGYAPMLTDSAVQTFKIENNGNAMLHLTGAPRVSISGPHAGDFHVVTQPGESVAPGWRTTFQMMFRPTAGGVRTAMVSIANDDDTEHPYTFMVQGQSDVVAVPLAHNPVMPQDVSGDLRVTPRDMLILVNSLLSQSAAPAAAPLAASEPAAQPAADEGIPMSYFIDVNADGRLTPADLLGVINYLLTGPAAAPAASPLAEPAVDEALVLFDDMGAEVALAPVRVEVRSAEKESQAAFCAATDKCLEVAAAQTSLADDDKDAADEAFEFAPLALALDD